MTPAQFEAAASDTRLKDRARRLARAILVDGVAVSEAARNEGVSRQAAAKAADTVRRASVNADGLRPVTVKLPDIVATELERIAAACRTDQDLAKKIARYLSRV